MSKRKLRNSGVTTDVTLDATKTYKYSSAGALVELTGSASDNDIVFSGSKSSLKRISDLERNLSILAARTQTEDGAGTGDGAGVVEKANKLATSRTISLTGDVTGSASFDGSANASITATIAANSVALGTDTTGNYVASLVAGTGITLTNNTGESATPTVAVDTSTIATQSWVTTQIATKDNTDEITEGATNLYFTNARARGAVSFTAGSGAYNSTTGVFTIPTNTNQLTNGASFITLASLSGTAPVSYNSGTGAFSMAAANSTTNGYMSSTYAAKLDGIASGATANTGTVTSVAAGSYLTGGTITTSGTLAVDATSANTASKVVARDASGNFSAGTITATLSGTATGLAGTPNITVGTITSGAIAATGAITATGDITAYFSDLRLKTNIVPIADALAKVEALNGVEFDPNETALSLGVDNKHQIGVIAQEVEAVAPELVVDSAIAGYKTVKYDKLTALLIEAVKELSAKVKTLEAQLGGSAPQL